MALSQTWNTGRNRRPDASTLDTDICTRFSSLSILLVETSVWSAAKAFLQLAQVPLGKIVNKLEQDASHWIEHFDYRKLATGEQFAIKQITFGKHCLLEANK